MKADADKKRKFHESLLQLLYPPPATKEDNHDSVYATQGSNLDKFPDDLKLERGSSYSSSSDQDESEGEGEGEGEGDAPKNLTRAQRKRLRRKKLKEAASNRRKLIGPILPAPEDDAAAAVNDEEVAVGVPQNPDIGAKNSRQTSASDNALQLIPKTELTTFCSKRNKQKHRRMAKKLAGERLKFSSTVDQGGSLSENGDLSYSDESHSDLRDQIDKTICAMKKEGIDQTLAKRTFAAACLTSVLCSNYDLG